MVKKGKKDIADDEDEEAKKARVALEAQEAKDAKDAEKDLQVIESILKEAKKLWKNLPSNEIEFLAKGAEYLNKAYEKHPAIKSVVTATDLMLMLAGIYMKMKDEKKGLEYYNLVIQSGGSSKTKIEQRLKRPGITEEEIKNLNMQIKKISVLVGKARDMVADIQAEKFRKLKEQAMKIVKKMEGQEPEFIREALQKKGFQRRVIDVVAPLKKKKLFGLF